MNKEITIALVGNPNCGKTTIFNALTGGRQHVGNWPGVTVEKKEGYLEFQGVKFKVVDLPGTYSMGAYSEDEVVARNFILKNRPDIIVNVVDATNVERNLYLTTQLLEMNSNVILALNMIDEAKNKQINIDIEKLSYNMKVDIVPTVAVKNKGIEELIKSVIEVYENRKKVKHKIDYGQEMEQEIKKIEEIILEYAVDLEYPAKWTAIKLFENDEYILELIKEKYYGEIIISALNVSVGKIIKLIGYEPESLIVDKRYEFISNITNKSIKRNDSLEENNSDKIDKVITNRWLGIPIFVIIMFLVYQITMGFGNDLLGGFVEGGFTALGHWMSKNLSNLGASDLFISFVVDGIIGGMGSVLVFVPLIFVMYLLISILEDSGYMARAAYVMDRFMTSIGLHGKTAISMIIGSGCNVAGIMSTRTLDSKKDRIIAILINPFISCSARLPVYALFAGVFFANKKIGIFSVAGLVIFSLYVLGIIIAILMGKIFSKYMFKGEPSYFVMELPPYRIPTLKSIFIHMWEKAEVFVKKAGTIIFGIVIVIWFLSNMPFGVEPSSYESILGIIGSKIAPIFKPAGFGTWQSGVALVTGILAKEAVVATLGTVYSVAEGPALELAIKQAFTPLTAYSFMVMSLLYTPCCATLGAIRREANSIKLAVFTAIYTFAIGWTASVLVYQIGKMLGFS